MTSRHELLVEQKLDRRPQLPFGVFRLSRHIVEGLELQSHLLSVDLEQSPDAAPDGNGPVIAARRIPRMTHAKRDVYEVPRFTDLVDEERFAKQLVDFFLAKALSESPGLPEEETGSQPVDLGTEVGSRPGSVLRAL